MEFGKLLTNWYLENRRNLPWRETTDPYAIWLSEIILQQTRVAQGMPYYLAFMDAFPTVAALANADEQQVLRLWQGLGYYSRARNLHAAARFIAHERGSQFPESYRELLTLKGVGTYTAAAIASISYGERVPVVDGNVFRVLSRVFGIDTDIAQPSAKGEFTELAATLMTDDPATFNQAMMEFGALQCVPKNPDCRSCIFNHMCYALQHRMVDRLPVKSKKAKARERHFNYLVFRDAANQTIVRQRTGRDIWKNLYEFPLVETTAPVNYADHPDAFPLAPAYRVSEPVRVLHKLTHQHLHISFWKVDVDTLPEQGVNITSLKDYPFPIALHNFIEASLL